MKLQNARGVRDFKPAEKKIRQYIMSMLQETFEQFGYLPLETPIIERLDILTSKYAGGEEILKEIYTFEDQGKRKLALRYDLTVPFSRFVGMNKELKMPFKRYQIGRVFRDGPVKIGRYREFWQCDVDMVGCPGVTAEAELLSVAKQAFDKLDLDVEIEVNSRKILNGILDQIGVPENKQETMILSVDKLKKIGEKGVREELKEKKFTDKQIKALFDFVNISGTNEEKLNKLKEKVTTPEGKEGIEDMTALFSYIDTCNILFTPFLARGLAYYTGMVFEAFLKDRTISKSAVAGGGRYDNMIGKFLNSKTPYPAVGISFGLELLSDIFVKTTPKQYAANLFIIPIKTFTESFKLANELRKKGCSVDIDLLNRGLSKNLKYAGSLKIPYVLIVGEDELKSKKYTLRDMNTGKEQKVDLKTVMKKIKS